MSTGKILVADDDRNICELRRLYLEKEGYSVVLANDGEEAMLRFSAENPDLILLDVMMPKLDGWQVCREIRKKSDCPIIMITAKGETFDKVLGLELGADDYVVKPFDSKEIVARIKAVMRRTGKSSSENNIKEVSYDKLVVNMTKYELKVDGRVVDTPPKELELLFHLASNPNRVYTRDQLLDEVWGFEYYGDSRTVDVDVYKRQVYAQRCAESRAAQAPKPPGAPRCLKYQPPGESGPSKRRCVRCWSGCPHAAFRGAIAGYPLFWPAGGVHFPA